MNIYIFPRIEKLTKSYHREGGLVVVAKDRAEVLSLLKGAGSRWDEIGEVSQEAEITEKEWEKVQIFELRDDNVKPCLFVFPDAGCCG